MILGLVNRDEDSEYFNKRPTKGAAEAIYCFTSPYRLDLLVFWTIALMAFDQVLCTLNKLPANMKSVIIAKVETGLIAHINYIHLHC